MNRKGIIFLAIISVVLFYLGDRSALLYQSLQGAWLERITDVMDQLAGDIAANPLLVSMSPPCLATGGLAVLAVWLCVLYNMGNGKNYRKGEEYGSAKWGTEQDRKYLRNRDPEKNIILSQTEYLNLEKAANFEYDRNKNVVVVGGSGSGKTYGVIKPNLMQLNSSVVASDPKGTLLPDVGHMFLNAGYEVRSFNTVNFSKSLHYNPLSYIHSEKDILQVVSVLIENTKGTGDKSGEDFWIKAERLWYTAIIGYLYYEALPEDRNLLTMIDMLDLSATREDDEDYKNPIDILFEDLETEKGDCFPERQYKKFKLAAGKTTKSVLISCAARLAPFDIQELRDIMEFDELRLDEIGDRKTALFVIMSDTDTTYNFVIAMMFYQMFHLLCTKADDVYGGELPVPVACVLDEFYNIGRINGFEHLISTIRSRKIFCSLYLQSLSQLHQMYKEAADTIIDCCDTMVFLGGKSEKTTKTIAEQIGKTTIDVQTYNENKGSNGSYTLNNQVQGRYLIDPSEIGRIKRTQCIVSITGVPPFLSDKYNPKKHKRYNMIADSAKVERYDITKLGVQQAQKFLQDIKEVQEITIDVSELNALV